MLQALQLALAAATIAIATLSIAVTFGYPRSGVVGDEPGGLIRHVQPGSAVWRDGIRSGHRVLEMDDSRASGGWRLMTTDGDVVRETSAASRLETLVRFRFWGFATLGPALIVALVAFRRHGIAAGLLPVTLAAAAEPLVFAGAIPATVIAGLAVFGAGGAAVLLFAPPTRWLPLAGIAAGIGMTGAAAWVASIFLIDGLFDTLDDARWPTALGFTVVGLGLSVTRRDMLGLLRSRRGPAFVDIAYGSTVIALLFAVGVIADVEVTVLAVLLVVSILPYPFWRRTAIGALERLFTSSARREAGILAIEKERSRLARDIHDSPLQELTGVIRRIESVPGATAEATALRNIAAHLREVATALQPPVLQDLGLAAAIEDLGEQMATSNPGWHMTVEVDDLTVQGRPPEDVELAAFRVVQEASANALAHSHGSTLTITGTISDDSVALDVTDDGQGFTEELVSIARRDGRFGLDSMRDRATSVGATTTITSRPGGALVSFRWLARR